MTDLFASIPVTQKETRKDTLKKTRKGSVPAAQVPGENDDLKDTDDDIILMPDPTPGTGTPAMTARARAMTEAVTEALESKGAESTPAVPDTAPGEPLPPLSAGRLNPSQRYRIPTDTKIYQPQNQYYEAARRARSAHTALEQPAKKLSRLKLKALIASMPDLSVDMCMAYLVALARKGLGVLHEETAHATGTSPDTARAAAALVGALTREETDTLFGDITALAHRGVFLARESMKAARTEDEARGMLNATLNPKAIATTNSPAAFIEFDSVHDGHLTARESAYALGIVRTARALSNPMRERIATLFSRLPGLACRPLSVWREARPLVLARTLTPQVEKLLLDAWVCDKRVALVLESEPAVRPALADVWGIPVITDSEGYLAALLGLDTERLPAVIDHVLGGVSITQATGYITPGKSLPAVVPWMKTLAETGFVRAARSMMNEKRSQRLTAPQRRRWLKTYRFISTDMPRTNPESKTDDADRERLRAARRAYLRLRDETLAALAAWADAAPDAHKERPDGTGTERPEADHA